MKKQRAQLRRRDDASLLKSAGKQAKMLVIKKQLGPDIKYNELPLQKRIQINQKIVSKKAKVIQKITKKILRKLKAGEGERVKKNRAALKAKLAQKVTQQENVDENSRLKRAYDDIIKDYSDMVQKGGGKHSNAFYLSRAANNYGIDSIKPIRQYVDSLIKDKKLSKDLTPYNEENESRGYFTRTKSQSSKGKALLRTVKSDLEKVLKGIQHKLEPDSSGNRIIITVNKSDVDKVRKLVGLPNLTKVVSEEVELDENEALKNKAKKSGMPYSILKKVYDRGMAAYKTGHRPGTTAQQWAMARVNSFTTKSSGTWGKADADLAKQVRGEGVKQDPDIKDREGTQPAKYYAKDADGDEMSTSTKKARARHFAKKKKGPAPGDASADTKPSVHTKKFKQMYGEGVGDVVKSIQLLTKYYKTRKDEDAFKAIKFGWSYIQNPKVREMIVSLIKYIANKSGHNDWNNTVKYIKKNTGVDITDYEQDWKRVKGGYTFTKFVPERKKYGKKK
jgi:hypothetical protein